MEDNIKDFIVEGLCTDGGHHKQWYLEQVLIKLGFDLSMVKGETQALGYDWDGGVPP